MAHTSETLRRDFRYLYPRELPLLKALPYLVDRSPVVVVNIGAGSGTSGLAFLETRHDLILHTVDITNDNSPFGCLYAEREVVKAAGLGELYGSRWFQHHIDSKALAKDWTQPCDIVFVDGAHGYEDACGDILGWLPHIRNGGYMAIHDYRKGDILPTDDGPHPMVWEGVDRAVDDLLLDKQEFVVRVESLIVFRIKH